MTGPMTAREELIAKVRETAVLFDTPLRREGSWNTTMYDLLRAVAAALEAGPTAPSRETIAAVLYDAHHIKPTMDEQEAMTDAILELLEQHGWRPPEEDDDDR